MKEHIDNPPSKKEIQNRIDDYPRLAREYTLLHADYRACLREINQLKENKQFKY